MFPIISHINDVLPHIEGNDSFFVKDIGDHLVVNYRSISNAWTNGNDVGEKIRRECRGIKFYKNGMIAARPFQKFFNVGERDETRLEILQFNIPHSVYTKYDGSMIHPVMMADKSIRLMTKMGITETSIACKHEHANPDFLQVCYNWIDAGYTPIFEWIAPQNQIVVSYDKSELVLLAIRNTIDGKYFRQCGDLKEEWVRAGVSISNAEVSEKFSLDEIRSMIGREGVVVRWPNGFMVKAKSDWYAGLHRQKDRIMSSSRDALGFVLTDSIDDVLPILSPQEQEKIIHLRECVEKALCQWSKMILNVIWNHTLSSQKEFAVSSELKTLEQIHPILKSTAFAYRKSEDVGDIGDIGDTAVLHDMLVEKMKEQTNDTQKAASLEAAILLV